MNIMLNLNLLAKDCYFCALKREKIKINSTILQHRTSIIMEDIEFIDACETPDKISAHLPSYNEIDEEAIDGIITRLTFLASREINIEKLLKEKVEFNKTRI